MILRSDVWMDGRRYWDSHFRAVIGEDRATIRIWLIDDGDEFRSLLAELLGTERGFDCSRQFSNAADALVALQNETAPDVILLDIHMRGKNGLDAVRPIKSLAPGTRVLMLTTFFDSRSRERALAEGASDFLLKSYPIEEITERIRQTGNPGRQVVPDETPSFASSALPEIISSDRARTNRPKRRASELNNDRVGNGSETCSPPDEGRRSAPLPASSRLTRGVRFFQSLLS
jgi:DNA-binding NarL/FixJ family response regulator